MVLRKRDAFESELDETYSASGYRDNKNTFQTICAFLALLFATIFASIPLYSFHLRSGSMNSASFACLPRIRRKMGMMDFYKNFEIWERTSTAFLVYDCGFTSSKRHFYISLFSSVFAQLIDNEPFREVHAFQFQLFQLIFSVLIFFLYYIYYINI